GPGPHSQAEALIQLFPEGSAPASCRKGRQPAEHPPAKRRWEQRRSAESCAEVKAVGWPYYFPRGLKPILPAAEALPLMAESMLVRFCSHPDFPASIPVCVAWFAVFSASFCAPTSVP